MREVVDDVGETTWDPFSATGVPFRSALTALLVVHVNVELPPDAIVVGDATIPAAGVCARAIWPRAKPTNQQAAKTVRNLECPRWSRMAEIEAIRPMLLF